MAKTLRTSGDYTIKAGDGFNSGSGTNTINLDSLNVSITGNLTVAGTSSTISTTNTVIQDNIIELQTGISASSNDSGIIIERGSTGDNAAIVWDESVDSFKLGTTTATGTDKSGGITVTAGALEIGALTATTGTFSGAVTSVGSTVTGNFTAGSVTTNEIAGNGSNAAITVTSSGTGDITLDAGGDIILDADNADIKLKDGGTEFGRISRVTSDLVIKSMGDNNDIILKGLDDSATINALTLDMSAAGAATFNSTVTATDITANSLTTNVISSNGSNADLNISASGTGDVAISSQLTLTGSFKPAIHTFTGTDAVTETEHAGRTLLLGEVGGNANVVLTLPDATGSGNIYHFIVSVAMGGSTTYKIQVPDADNTITGQIMYLDEDGTAVTSFPTVAASDTITLNSGTQGGLVGDTLTLIDIAADKYAVSGNMRVAAGANPSTPFSAAVS